MHYLHSFDVRDTTQMKKILIFSSYGGGGHISATDALKEYLHEDYEINTIYLIDDTIACLDFVRIFSFNYYSSERFYNYCLQKKWTWFINKLYQLAIPLNYYSQGIINRLVTKCLLQQKPDLVISVIPILNNSLKDCCLQQNIPFLLIPTDLDSTSFVRSIQKPLFNKFALALPFDDPDILQFSQRGIYLSSSRFITGFPIKSSFFAPKDKEQIKKDFNIPPHKPVILVFMGAAGSQALYHYLLTLLRLKIPVHLILCLGRNESLRSRIEQAPRPPHITVSIISYTNRIADLMTVSDICITKAGTVSVCEAIYMNLPLILDNTSTPLLWEKFNIEFIQKHGFGSFITHYKQLNPLVIKMITNKEYYTQCKNNLLQFPKKNFGDCIKDVIAELLPPHRSNQKSYE